MLVLRSLLEGRLAMLAGLVAPSRVAPAGAGIAADIKGALEGLTGGWAWPWGRGSAADADTSVLEAAPKKRTSHQKKRQRQLAGNNQQKLLRNLNRCPSCGHYKRAHTLCMHCVQEIQAVWRARDRAAENRGKDQSKYYQPGRLSQEDTDFNYPERVTRPSVYQKKLADTASYVLRRPRTLPVPPKSPKQKNLPLEQRKPLKL